MLKAGHGAHRVAPHHDSVRLADDTPAYAGLGAPRAVISAPAGGTNILSARSLDRSSQSARRGVVWRAGANSLIDDVRFLAATGPSGTNPYE